MQNLKKVGNPHPGIAVDEVQHAVMGAAKAFLIQNTVRIAGEIAISEEQGFDIPIELIMPRLRGSSRPVIRARGGRRILAPRCVGNYVSHVDIFGLVC